MEMRESEEKFKISVENMLDCFGLYSAIRDESGHIVDFRIDYVNEAACKNNLMTNEEQIGMRLCELLPAHQETELFEEYCQLVETGKPLSKISFIYDDVFKKKRLIRAFDIRATKLGDGFAATWRDVSDRILAEEALRESEEKYHDLYDNAPDMFISVCAKTSTILNCNQTLSNKLGYTKEEIIGRPIFDMYTPDSAEHAKASVFPVFTKTGTITGEELELQRKDGSKIDVLLNVSAVRDEQGNIIYSRSIWHDITERKLAEETLRERVKELTGLHALSRDMQRNLSIDELCRRIVEHLEVAMQFPEITVPVIELNGRRFTSENYTEELSHSLHADIRVEAEAHGHLRVYYTEEKPFLIPEEQNLLNSFADDLSTWLKRKQAEEALKDRERDLMHKSKRLEEVNTALNVLLKKRDEDKLMIEEKVLFNVKELIEPLIENLKNSGLDENQTGYVNTLETFLADIVSPFSQTLHSKFLGLTLSEIRVANLIKKGKTTKEITGLLNSTPGAIEFHRKNLRKKLGLSNRKVNLGSHLLSLLK